MWFVPWFLAWAGVLFGIPIILNIYNLHYAVASHKREEWQYNTENLVDPRKTLVLIKHSISNCRVWGFLWLVHGFTCLFTWIFSYTWFKKIDEYKADYQDLAERIEQWEAVHTSGECVNLKERKIFCPFCSEQWAFDPEYTKVIQDPDYVPIVKPELLTETTPGSVSPFFLIGGVVWLGAAVVYSSWIFAVFAVLWFWVVFEGARPQKAK